MTDNLEALSGLIKKELENYEDKIDVGDVGTVVTIGDGIALIYGLKKVMMSELLIFPNDVYGMVMNLEENSVGCVLLGKDSLIHEGDIVKRTHKVVEVGVGDELLGRVINALGKPIDGLGEIKTTSTRPIEMPAPKIMDRESVNTPLLTGIKAIDSMIPIGKGQRELIIGDRQTGKTAIAIDTILNQKDKNVYCIYVAIGQKNSSIAQLVSKLEDYGAMKYTTIVCAGASESAPLLYIAPYAATSIAEYWMLQGKDVLIVYDDLSKHAVAYRTLSLLLKRSPGREAYPGDIFYIHSRLLERACHLKKELGGGSITALPIIETQAGDISAYIPTNVISITDGQIFLSSELFNKGQRPAIDSGLSVSRVGSAAQYKSMKYVSASMKIELANYLELLEFSRFGSDLDKSTKEILEHGKKVMELLKQPQYAPMDVYDQIMVLFSAKHRFIKKVPLVRIKEYQAELLKWLHQHHENLFEDLKKMNALDETLENTLKNVMMQFTDEFINI